MRSREVSLWSIDFVILAHSKRQIELRCKDEELVNFPSVTLRTVISTHNDNRQQASHIDLIYENT